MAGLDHRLLVLEHCRDLFENASSLACPSEPAHRPSGGGDCGVVNPPRFAGFIRQGPVNDGALQIGTLLTVHEVPFFGSVRQSDCQESPGNDDGRHGRHMGALRGSPPDTLNAMARCSGARKNDGITDHWTLSTHLFPVESSPLHPSCDQQGWPAWGPSSQSDALAQKGLIKQKVNPAAVVDLLIAGLARHLWGTSQRSDCSDLMDRKRMVAWLKSAVAGKRLNLLGWTNAVGARFLLRCYLGCRTRWGRRLGWMVG